MFVFLWQLRERHSIHFLTLGCTAPLKSALEPDKGLDKLIKVESEPVYDKISPWTLLVLLFYGCIKSGREREDATATHRHDCCGWYDSFLPNVPITGNKCTRGVKYNSLRFSFNTATRRRQQNPKPQFQVGRLQVELEAAL